MKRPLLESEKNFLKCAFLMLVCSIMFFYMGKTNFGIVCAVIAVVFAVITVVMYVKNDSRK